MAGRIRDQDIEEVRRKAGLIEIASEYMQVRKAGSARFKALCPFHQEKTPSFSLDASKNLWHCFGCGKGGDAISLVQELEGLTFVEAVERLAARVGVRLTYERMSAAARQESGKKQRLIAAHREAVSVYHELLMTSDEGKPARDYLIGRRLQKETVIEFSLGWSPGRWDTLSRHLRKRGFAEEELIEAGLALRSDRGGLIDRFRSRIMFPTFDRTGNPIGFGGRVLDDSSPKYLNTAETPIFKKGRALYGLNWARQAISATRRVIVVEGYMDVIGLHQVGVRETVATNGTTLTTEHFELIRPFEPRVVVVAFDSDQAGSAAIERSFGAALDSRLDVRALILPNKDPAEFAEEHGGDAFRALLSTSEPVSVFRLRREVDRVLQGDAEAKEAAIRTVRPVFSQLLAHPTLYAEGIRIVAGQLDIDSKVLEHSLREMGLAIEPNLRGSATKVGGKLTARAMLEREVLLLALQYPEAVRTHVDGVEPDMFSVPTHRTLWREIVAGTDTVTLRDRVTDEVARDLVSELTNDTFKGELINGSPSESYVTLAINRMKAFSLRRLIAEKKEELQKLNPLENEEEYRKRYAELIALEGERKRVGGALDEEPF